jgi:transcriptional regulator with XRE-family HTH domain
MNGNMSNIISGRQLRATRVLAGLTQREFSKAVGVDERAARYWEVKGDKLPTSVPHYLEQIEAVLHRQGAIAFSSPTPSVRLAETSRVCHSPAK